MTADRPAEIKALAGARALPPLMIVLYHFCTFHHHVPAANVLGPPIAKGYLWVEFFFALSGFVLTHVYAARAREFLKRQTYFDFLKLRLARLYPVHFVTLVLIVLLMGTLRAFDAIGYAALFGGSHAPLNTWQTFLANIFLVQAWNTVPDLTWNSVSWFVSVEFLLCLAFPLYLLVCRGGAGRGLILIAAGFVWLAVLALPSGVGLDITFNNGVFRGMAGFAVGAGMATVHRRAAARVPDWACSAAQAAAVIFLFWALYFSGPDHTPADLWTAAAVDALLFVLALDRGFLARTFCHPALLKLGEWSYGIYMGQILWLQLAHLLERHGLIAPRAAALEMGAVLLVSIGWGALLATFVEQPANARLRKLLAQRKQARPA